MKRPPRMLLVGPLLMLLLLLAAFALARPAVAPAPYGQTVPPTATRSAASPTPSATPSPTLGPTRGPTSTPRATPTATATPRSTATPSLPGAVAVRGDPLRRVFGDRLSPLVYAIGRSGRLYRTDDDGQTWESTNPNPPQARFLVSPADPDRLYAGGSPRCFDAQTVSIFGLTLRAPAAPAEADALEPPFARSADGGATWTMDVTLPAADPILEPLLAHPTEPLTLLAAGCRGLYVTYDGGDSWHLLVRAGENGLPAQRVVQRMAAAYAAVNPDLPAWDALFAVAYNADGDGVVLFSDDEGRKWDAISPLLSGPNPAWRFPIAALAADPASAERLWFAAGDAVWSTTDQGQFWGLSRQGLPSGVTLTALLHHPSERLLLGTTDGLFSKGAAEARWNPVPEALPGPVAVASLLFTDADPNRLWLTTPDGVFRYTLRPG